MLNNLTVFYVSFVHIVIMFHCVPWCSVSVSSSHTGHSAISQASLNLACQNNLVLHATRRWRVILKY